MVADSSSSVTTRLMVMSDDDTGSADIPADGTWPRDIGEGSEADTSPSHGDIIVANGANDSSSVTTGPMVTDIPAS